MKKLILAIESSCDETAASVILDGNKVLSSVVSSQIDVHSKFGGVMPEIASRLHVEQITVVIKQALEQANVTMEEISAIAVTNGKAQIDNEKCIKCGSCENICPVEAITIQKYGIYKIKILWYNVLIKRGIYFG